MSQKYRVFLRDDHGFIQKVIELECLSDEDGREKMVAYKGARSAELWQGARLVYRVDGDGKELPMFD